MKPAPATPFPGETLATARRRAQARLCALTLLAAFLLSVVYSQGQIGKPRFLGARFAPCDGGLCVSWVMPVTDAWRAGVRPGDRVLSVDGVAVSAGAPADAPRLADDTFAYRKQGGEIAVLERPEIVMSPLTWSALWSIGAFIAGLGALILIRRPDLTAARLFGLFALAASVGLAIGPAAGFTHRPPALILQYVAVVALGSLFLPLTLALIERTESWSLPALAGTTVVATVMLGAYALAVVRFPDWYHGCRLAAALWLGSSVVASIACLALLGTRQTPLRRKQAWIVLAGFALGMLPFLFLTYLPMALGLSPQRAYTTALPFVFIPAGFAVAILQYEMLGIRRLIHRGLVYGVTGATLLAAVSVTVGLLGREAGPVSAWALTLIVVAGVLIFRPLETLVHRLIDRFIYRDAVDYGTVIDTVRTDLLQVEHAHGIVRTLLGRVVDTLGLESALLYLGDPRDGVRPAVEIGPHSSDVSRRLAQTALPAAVSGRAVEFSWQSNSMLLTPLSRGDNHLGRVIWGPKLQGEVFIANEVRLIEAMTPILTLVLEERALSERLRNLNKRLLLAQEAERRRIAKDLHDGPLQKAALLGGLADGPSFDRQQLARELSEEIREICARLRPAILDDLGLIPALDWLLGEVKRQGGVETRLDLDGIDDESRFHPDLELAFFRVTQESMNNVVKHAGASTIDVALSRESENLILNVRDDGVGFTVDQTSRSGTGLAGMRERIQQIGGRLEIRSRPGSGTELWATAPIGASGTGDAEND